MTLDADWKGTGACLRGVFPQVLDGSWLRLTNVEPSLLDQRRIATVLQRTQYGLKYGIRQKKDSLILGADVA